jgi:uncharacterized protein (TIGR02246 family)
MKQKHFRIALITSLAAIAFISCNENENNAKLIELQKETTEQWDKAVNAGDADAVASFYTEDATRMEQHKPSLQGKEAIRNSFKSFFDQNELVVNNITTDVVVSGEYAISNGTYISDYRLKSDSNAVHDVGKWVCIRKLQPDGSWKTVMDIWNSDLPAMVANK